MSFNVVLASVCAGGSPGKEPLLEQGALEEQGDHLTAGGEANTEGACVTTEVSGGGGRAGQTVRGRALSTRPNCLGGPGVSGSGRSCKIGERW